MTMKDNDGSLNLAVEITNGFKHYGIYNNWQTVLQRFNLTAYPGELYVILGPRGCGKTTVLNVILGSTVLNQGKVEVFGYKPGTEGSGVPGLRVGYAPQDYGLYENFTVTEILKYYGMLLGLPQHYVNERMAFLDILLTLPARNILVKHCAETTKRQISFAIALLHEPELLILDEPTAGVDPVLRKSIWSHLERLSYGNTTIIVATSIAAEAQNAHRIGIMRGGYLLLEGRPTYLMEKFKENTVEDLFHKVYSLNFLYTLKDDSSTETSIAAEFPDVFVGEYCFIDNIPARSTPTISVKQYETRFTLLKDTFLNQLYPNPRRLLVLWIRDCLRIIRILFWILLFFILPIFVLICFAGFLGSLPAEVPIALVNYDLKGGSCESNSLFRNTCSCLYVRIMESYGMRFREFKDANYAWKKVLYDESLVGRVIIGPNFTHIYCSKNVSGVYNHYPANYTNCGLKGTRACVELTIDESDKQIAHQLLYIMTSSYRDFQRSSISWFNGSVMFYDLDHYEDFNSSVKHVVVPGIIVGATYSTAMFLGPYAILKDNANNLAIRSYLAGVKTIEIVMSQLLSYCVLVHLQYFLSLAMDSHFENYKYKYNLGGIFLLMWPVVWCGYTCGLLATAVLKRKKYFIAITVMFLVICMVISGLLWSANTAPTWFQPVITLTPHYYPSREIRSLLLKNAGLGTIRHSPPVLGTWTAIFIVLYWIARFLLPD